MYVYIYNFLNITNLTSLSVIILFAAISFIICVANRYKLNKNYAKLKAKSESHPDDLAIKTRCTQAEVRETGVCVDELIGSGFIQFLSRLDLNTSYLIFF